MGKYDALVDLLVEAVRDSHLNLQPDTIPVGVSNRHVHLSQADQDALFGPGSQLTKIKDISQPGQFACKETVTLAGPKGVLENTPYPGIGDLLARLRQRGKKLYVATSKVEDMAHVVLNRFDLMKYFDGVTGSTPDGSRVTKVDVINVMLQEIHAKSPVLVGDTIFDVEGAAAAGIPCIGVSWGYGNREQMLSAGAVCAADTMDELFSVLTTEDKR